MDEGEMQVYPGHPYEIPYMVLLPTRGEVNNLLVPVGVSASHVGFTSIRVEPTWMIIGQSAGIYSSIVIGGKSIPKFGYWSPKEGISNNINKLHTT